MKWLDYIYPFWRVAERWTVDRKHTHQKKTVSIYTVTILWSKRLKPNHHEKANNQKPKPKKKQNTSKNVHSEKSIYLFIHLNFYNILFVRIFLFRFNNTIDDRRRSSRKLRFDELFHCAQANRDGAIEGHRAKRKRHYSIKCTTNWY